jgi:hypothetical protein
MDSAPAAEMSDEERGERWRRLNGQRWGHAFMLKGPVQTRERVYAEGKCVAYLNVKNKFKHKKACIQKEKT